MKVLVRPNFSWHSSSPLFSLFANWPPLATLFTLFFLLSLVTTSHNFLVANAASVEKWHTKMEGQQGKRAAQEGSWRGTGDGTDAAKTGLLDAPIVQGFQVYKLRHQSTESQECYQAKHKLAAFDSTALANGQRPTTLSSCCHCSQGIPSMGWVRSQKGGA